MGAERKWEVIDLVRRSPLSKARTLEELGIPRSTYYRRQRLGALSKQGNPLLRYLWCEAAIHAVRHDPELQRFYRRKLVQKGLGKARIAAARQLGIRLWIMLRDQIDYQEFRRRGQMRQKSCGAHAGMPGSYSGPAVS